MQRCGRHRGHLVFAACCMSASQPRQTACGQCQRYGGARERASRTGHGELNVSMHTEQSSPVHSGSGGAAGTHPRGRPPGRGIEPKAASAVARSPKAWRRCSSNPATHTCSRWARAALSKFRSLERSRLAAAGSHTPATHSEAAGSLRRRSRGAGPDCLNDFTKGGIPQFGAVPPGPDSFSKARRATDSPSSSEKTFPVADACARAAP